MDPKLVGFDIGPMIRFTTPAEAEQRRAELVRFIWPEGLPATRPQVTSLTEGCPELQSIERTLYDNVDRFDIDVSGFDFHAMAYVAHPTRPADEATRLAIVFAGHMPEGEQNYLNSGLGDSVQALLREGYIVAAMQMPLVGWNADRDGVLPSGMEFSIQSRGTRGHDELFAAVEPELKGGTLRFFLEPIVQTINELQTRHPENAGVLMIGLSGGGWTTQLAAALEPRIDVSIPVAGSLPLYARPFSRGSRGDAEQEYGPLFGEEDTNADAIPDKATGVCSWLEIYALGGISPDAGHPRRQVQVINLYDSCCFSGLAYASYCDALARRVHDLNGDWQVFIDASHRDHLISPHVIEQILIPAARGVGK